ncbi:zinc finger protein 34-like [Ruditapes philippinarum]|uniref:zinc finger protein 34-like n=1 Tax=Ruditapes philippinarum TaxID=129788 RepID=UPI00295BBBA5|nr:zinc finger protein 34-like [Ruditapes philippinarum]
MVAIFCRVTAELARDFIENFPRQFDFNGMLTKICDDIDVDISFQNETYLLQGDWNNLGRAYNMLVSTLAVYGNASSVAKGSRPFSALVEAAEAISRGVELQEQVQNEMTQMNKVNQYNSIPQFPIKYHDHEYDRVSRYSQNSMDEQESTSECSIPDSLENMDKQKDMQSTNLPEFQEESQSSYDTIPVTEQNDSKFFDAHSDTIEVKDIKKEVADDQYVLESYKNIPKQSIISQKIDESLDNDEDEKFNDLTVNKLKEQKEGLQGPIAKCDICEKVFSNVPYMKRHRNCHKDVFFSCDECGKKYKVQKALREHKKTHDEGYLKPKFKCESCPKSFCSNYLKECHIKSEHLGLKKYFLCQTCGKSFTTKHTLQQHVNAHTGVRPYQCTKCGKCFTYEAALRDHRFTHIESKTFTCEYPGCDKAFRQRSALKMHEKIHKNPNQFECTECGRGFTQKQALQRHINSHKGFKPFRCKYCDRTFGDPAIIRRHLKLVHKLNKDVDKWREDIIEETVQETKNDKDITSLNSDTIVTVSQGTALENVPLLQTNDTKVIPYKSGAETLKPVDIKHISGQDEEPNTDPELNTDHIQNVFVSYNVPSQNLVLTNTQAADFSQSTAPLIQYHFKSTEEVETGSTSTEATDIENVNSKAESIHELVLHHESDTAMIEREQIQFLTENLDGTFNTTIDLNKLKRNLELLTKPNATVDLNLVTDVPTETLKPDGTSAEMPLNTGLENTTRFGEIEALSDSLGQTLPQCQYYYYSIGNQYINLNQNQLNSGLNVSDNSTDREIP